MILVEAVFSYCRFVRLDQSVVSFMLFYPKLDGPSALSNVHLAALTGDLVYISCFFTTVKTWSKELRNISDKSLDGSSWANWMTSITLFCLLPAQYLMLQFFAPLLCYSFFYFPTWNKKGKRCNKIKTSRPFSNAKYWEFYICRWIDSQHKCQSYMKLSTNEWNKYYYIYHQA